MRQIVGLLLLTLLLSSGLAPLLPRGLDACSDDGCTPVTCSQVCPACVCAFDRDRIAPPTTSSLPVLDPLLETPHTRDVARPQPCAQEILHVPKATLA